MERPVFASTTMYGARFSDVVYWRPYVEEICRRHDLPCGEVRGGVAGTFPVSIVDERHVVKLFGDLFEGRHAFAVEMEVYRLLHGRPRIPLPTLLASGHLFTPNEPWSWPYTVTRFVPGESLGEADERLTYRDRLAVATYLGATLRDLHRVPLPPTGPLQRSWDGFLRFLTARRAVCVADHKAWAGRPEGGLPPALIAQIEAYLPPVKDLVDRRTEPCLAHADLNADHLLGEVDDGGWRTTALIDFGDARAGDPAYELPALHLGLFRCDKRLLRAFLAAYNWDYHPRADFVRQAMSMTLLFPFGVGPLVRAFPAAAHVTSLDELAHLLYDPESPGLAGSERP